MEVTQVFVDKQVVISRDAFGTLSIAGSIDHFNSDAIAAWLASQMQGVNGGGEIMDGDSNVTRQGDLVVELGRLEFSDVSGIRALVRVAENARDGRRLVLRGLPPQIARVMSVVGWSELPSLVVEGP
ncbi:MAG: STAS domain-containing protein [Candidatus Dormibacteraceae bacterium]